MKSRRTDWTKLAILLALGALLVHCCQRSLRAEPTTRPATRPFDLRSDDAGRLVFTPLLPGLVECGNGKVWYCGEADEPRFNDYAPAGYWTGHVTIRTDGDALVIEASRDMRPDWSVVEFQLIERPDATEATFLVRTPVGQPDVTYRVSDRHTALLMLRCPEVAWMLNECLRAVGADEYDPGPFVRDQLAGDVRVTAEVAERARVLIGLSGGPCWRNREAAIAALNGMGRDGASALLLLDRRGLTAGEQVAVERVLGAWPIVTREERNDR